MKPSFLSIFILLSANTLSAQEKIHFRTNQEYPEGIAWDASRNAFYVSSVRSGTIGKVDVLGNYSVLHTDPNLKSGFGMKVHQNLLWVCTGDPTYSWYSDSSTFKKMIRLIAIDLNSGQKIKDIDLSNLFDGKHFANDLTVDDEGNKYITDSYSPVIYKVDGNDKATVFTRSEYFRAGDVGLNGIVWHPSGYLLTVNNAQGTIYKVSTRTGTAISKVKIDRFFPGADGLLVDSKGDLLLVQNKGVNKMFRINSMDDFQSARLVAATAAEARFNFPSTATFRNGKPYVLNAKLHEIKDPGIKPSAEFIIQEAILLPVK